MAHSQAESTDASTDQVTHPIAGSISAFQRDILVAIASYRPTEWPATRRPFSEASRPHGLAIKAALEEFYGEGINHGRLYPNLDQLEEKGLVEKGTIDKRTNAYSITQKARDVLRERRDAYARALDGAESEVEDR